MIPLPHWRRGLDGQLARTNTPHRLWRLMLAAACAAEEQLLGRGEDAPRASPAVRANAYCRRSLTAPGLDQAPYMYTAVV